jgi:hypothetical protein
MAKFEDVEESQIDPQLPLGRGGKSKRYASHA